MSLTAFYGLWNLTDFVIQAGFHEWFIHYLLFLSNHGCFNPIYFLYVPAKLKQKLNQEK